MQSLSIKENMKKAELERFQEIHTLALQKYMEVEKATKTMLDIASDQYSSVNELAFRQYEERCKQIDELQNDEVVL